MPMRSPAAPPNTPPRPMPAAAPTARAPQYSSAPSKPDNKRKYAIFAGAGAAVVVLAVIVFLVANSGGSGGTGGTTNAQSPSRPTTGQSSPKPSSSDDAPASAKLGQTPSEGKITSYQQAGQLLANTYYPNVENGWSYLTPAAQAVYGSQDEYRSYWGAHKGDLSGWRSATAAGSGSDGSLDLTMELNGSRRKYHIVLVGGQLLIDSNTKLDANPDTGL
ncbi:hypothetical protein AB0M71_48430 [Amycolatopsis sp. NPDC051114]